METPPTHPSFTTVLRVWMKIGLLSFGGPAGQIAMMHRELVEKHRWVSDRRFLHALNYCMLLPGPEAQQLAVYTGWLLHKTHGGIVAGALFVLPGALLMLGISFVYVYFGKLPWMEAMFYGLKAAVMAVVISAVLRIGKKVLKHPVMWAISAVSFVAIFYYKVPFPVIVLGALGIGLFFGKRYPAIFDMGGGHGGKSVTDAGDYVISDEISSMIEAPTLAGTLRKILFWLFVWLVPLGLCLAWFGPHHVLTHEGVFFSKAALVTFGGAYAVLPYVAQQAVEVYGWLSAPQMMDGLALAETTPGPLILVLQFVGFLGAWNHPGTMQPWLAAILGAGITTWCTFIPGYLFIFAGAPFIERTRGDLRFNSALAAVTAAVVGVILNLSVWFAWHVVIPKPGAFDAIPLVLGTVFLFLIQQRKWGIIPIVGLGAAAGLALHLAGLR
ncbi:MAG: chromate efflux transporter [Gloeobacteraceae cyanobacterium ES-bin-144]|nr:chromate efflux transporter [Verrucomicrobiales bacterium]